MIEELRSFVKKEKLARHEGGPELQERTLQSRAEVSGNIREGQQVAIVNGERRVVLNEYLPQGIRFMGAEGAEFEYHRGRQGHSPPENLKEMPRIEFPLEKLNTIRGRLLLLHEIGHSKVGRSPEFHYNQFHRLLLNIADEIVKGITKSEKYHAMSSADERREYYQQEFKKAWEHESAERMRQAKEPFQPLRYDDLVDAITNLAKVERASWAEGLQLRSRIKREKDLDILEGANPKEIFKQIEAVSLASYENVYQPLLELIEEDKRLNPRSFIDRIFDRLARFAVS